MCQVNHCQGLCQIIFNTLESLAVQLLRRMHEQSDLAGQQAGGYLLLSCLEYRPKVRIALFHRLNRGFDGIFNSTFQALPRIYIAVSPGKRYCKDEPSIFTPFSG